MQVSRQRRAGDEIGVSGGSGVMVGRGAGQEVRLDEFEARLLWDKVGLIKPDLPGIERFGGCRALSDKTGTCQAKPVPDRNFSPSLLPHPFHSLPFFPSFYFLPPSLPSFLLSQLY